MNNFNIIENDEIIIGYKNNLIKYLKNEIIRLIDDDGVEEYIISDLTGVIRELNKKDDVLFKIEPCQMGGYSIIELED